MDGADHRLVEFRQVIGQLRTVAHRAPHPLAHLGGGGIGEGNRGNLRDAAVGKQRYVAIHQHPRLAAAGAGGNQDVGIAVRDHAACSRVSASIG